MDDLQGRVAFVTGAGSGMGLGIAEALVDAGVRVTLAGRTLEPLERAAARLGSTARVEQMDVTDRDAWAEAKRAAEAAFGPVDILVNSAGVGPDFKELADTAGEQVDAMIAVHLTSVCNGILAFADDMRARRSGHIVNNASLSGLLAGPRVGVYTAAKFGVVGLSEVLHAEMEPHGVGVSVICAGNVESNLLRHLAADELPPLPADVISARDAGLLVVDAVRREELYVLTHADYRDRVAARAERLDAAFERAAAANATLLAPPK